MKSKKIISFELLQAYAAGRLTGRLRREVSELLKEDRESAELVRSLELVYRKEGMGPEELDLFFGGFERRMERTVQLHYSFNNHLIELNSQLRRAAAIFILIFCFSFLMMGGDRLDAGVWKQNLSGPYDLAMGSKVAP